MASVSPEEPIPAGPPVADALAVDPVCGMPVARERAIALEHEGRLAYFCSRGCRDEFLGLGPAPLLLAGLRALTGDGVTGSACR